MPELLIAIRLRQCGPAEERFEAALVGYPLLVETGRTPWEAVNRRSVRIARCSSGGGRREPLLSASKLPAKRT